MVNRLRELRKKKKYTLDDIEAKTGVKRGTYNNYESGKTEPKPAMWVALADFFNVSVPYLKGYGYSKDYIYKLLDDAYKEPYTKDYEIEPPFTNPVLSAKEEIEKYCEQNKISIPKDIDLDFWKTNFNFIFNDKSVNRLLTTKDKYSDSDIKELIINAIYWHGLNPHTRELVNKLSHNS